jgi:hypothetical protein
MFHNHKTSPPAEHQWLTPVILCTQEQRSGGLRFEASLSK